ncbi:MAG: PaaI family thioesterase [Rhodospirillaceae bacterium]|nr:PaaI family thioesterase [Rhodospirillaceae bacterium]
MTVVDVTKLPSFKSREILGGIVLAIDDQTGAATLRYMPPTDLNNANGTLLGGYLTAMIDDAAGAATWFGCGQRNFATAQMSANFLRAAKPNESLIAEATIIGSGARQAFVEVRLKREVDGKIIATASLVQTFIST